MNQHACLLPLAISLLAACSDPDAQRIGSIEYADGPCRRTEQPARPSPPPSSLPPVAAFTREGDPAIVDAATGAVIASAPGGRAVGVRDIAWDPWSARLVVFESDEHEEGGEIVTYPVDASRGLLAREHRAWVDGIARIAASPLGIVVFEDGYGPRWKVLWNDGTPSQGVPASRPASVWMAPGVAGAALHALTYGPPGGPVALERRLAGVASGSLAVEAPLPLDVPPATDPPTARLVAAPALGIDVLFDVDGGVPVLRAVSGGATAELSALAEAAPVGRVEHVVALEGGRVIVALASSPARLIAALLDDEADVISEDAIDLPGAVRPESQFFSRELVAVADDRVLAVTNGGVFAVRVTATATSVNLDVDAGFQGVSLSGPLDALRDSAAAE